MNLRNFEEILLLVSSLAMNGCFFLGELPAWLAETDIANKVGSPVLIFFLCQEGQPLNFYFYLVYFAV